MITYYNITYKYECSRHLKVIKYDRVRNSSGRLFQYFGAATVKAASAYIDDTSDTIIRSRHYYRYAIVSYYLDCEYKL